MRGSIEKLTTLFLQNLPVLIFFLIPIFFLTNTVDFFAFNKFYLINLLASLSLLAWCLRNILNNRINLTLSPTLSLLFILVLAHISSALFMSPTKVLSMTGLTTLFSSLLILHLTHTSVPTSGKLIKRQIFALLFSLTLVNLLSVLHFFNLSSYIFGTTLTQSKFFNITGGIVPALTFSLPLILASLAYIFYTENFKTKIVFFVLSAITISATIINISLLLPKNSLSPVVVLPLKASWSIALDIFKYPGTALIGTGPENYLATFTRLRPSYLNAHPTLWNTRFSESGSFLLTILTTTGLIGGIAFFFAFSKNIFLGLRSLSSSENKPELSFVIASLIGFLIAAILTPMGLVSIIISLTLLATLTQIFKKNENKRVRSLHFNISDESHQSKALTSFLPVLTLIVSLFIIFTYWSFGYRFYYANALLSDARNKLSTDLVGSFLKQQQAQKLNPYDATYSLVLSQTYQQVALYYLQKQNTTDEEKKNTIETMQRTIDAGRLAAKTDPFSVLVWENLSGIYQSFIGAADGAENLAASHLAQAISLDPTNPKLRLQLGILFYNMKDLDQAAKMINQAIELKPNWEIPYLNLYRIYSEVKNYQKAENNLKQAISLVNPQSEDYQKLQEELRILSEKVNTK